MGRNGRTVWRVVAVATPGGGGMARSALPCLHAGRATRSSRRSGRRADPHRMRNHGPAGRGDPRRAQARGAGANTGLARGARAAPRLRRAGAPRALDRAERASSGDRARAGVLVGMALQLPVALLVLTLARGVLAIGYALGRELAVAQAPRPRSAALAPVLRAFGARTHTPADPRHRARWPRPARARRHVGVPVHSQWTVPKEEN